MTGGGARGDDARWRGTFAPPPTFFSRPSATGSLPPSHPPPIPLATLASPRMSSRDRFLRDPSVPITSDELRWMLENERCVVKFTAPWCGPCKAIQPDLVALCATHGFGEAPVAIDVDEYPTLAAEYNITQIPHIILASDGVMHRITGANFAEVERRAQSLGPSPVPFDYASLPGTAASALVL